MASQRHGHLLKATNQFMHPLQIRCNNLVAEVLGGKAGAKLRLPTLPPALTPLHWHCGCSHNCTSQLASQHNHPEVVEYQLLWRPAGHTSASNVIHVRCLCNKEHRHESKEGTTTTITFTCVFDLESWYVGVQDAGGRYSHY
jgi:hypothetical protein